MRKNGIGWIVAIIFILAFGFLLAAYSELKEEHQIEKSQNYYDFHSGVTADIQFMEQILSLEKLVATGNIDEKTLPMDENEWGLQGGPFVDVGLSDAELNKFSEYRNNSVLAIIEFQRTGQGSEIETLATNLAAYEHQFSQWVEEVNKCSHLSGFCAGDGSEAYQQPEK